MDGKPNILRSRRYKNKKAVYFMEGRCGALFPNGLCSIYDRRPHAFRTLVPGSENCLLIRREKGLGELEY